MKRKFGKFALDEPDAALASSHQALADGTVRKRLAATGSQLALGSGPPGCECLGTPRSIATTLPLFAKRLFCALPHRRARCA